jgi:hypothetical protein
MTPPRPAKLAPRDPILCTAHVKTVVLAVCLVAELLGTHLTFTHKAQVLIIGLEQKSVENNYKNSSESVGRQTIYAWLLQFKTMTLYQASGTALSPAKDLRHQERLYGHLCGG